MKVKELKEKLNEFPDDMEVCVNGYEDGYDYIAELRIAEVSFDEHTEDSSDDWWCGRHQDVGGLLSNDEDIRDILVIPRKSNR